MANRFHDYNMDGEQRLLLGRECLSTVPVAIHLEDYSREPLAVRQMREMAKQQQILADEGFEESDEDFFDFGDEITYEDYADNLSYFQGLSEKLEEYEMQRQSDLELKKAEKRLDKASQEADLRTSEPEVANKPSGED